MLHDSTAGTHAIDRFEAVKSRNQRIGQRERGLSSLLAVLSQETRFAAGRLSTLQLSQPFLLLLNRLVKPLISACSGSGAAAGVSGFGARAGGL